MWFFSPLGFYLLLPGSLVLWEYSWYVVSWREPHSKKQLLLANSQWRPEACQQIGEWGGPGQIYQGLGSQSSLVMTTALAKHPECSIVKALWTRGTQISASIYDPRRNKCSLLEVAKFLVFATQQYIIIQLDSLSF